MGTFVQGIGMNDNLHFIKYNDIQDAAKFIVCGDVGNWTCLWDGPTAAFPDRWIGICIAPNGATCAAPARSSVGASARIPRTARGAPPAV